MRKKIETLIERVDFFKISLVFIGISIVGLLGYHFGIYVPKQEREELIKFYYKECRDDVDTQLRHITEQAGKNCTYSLRPKEENEEQCLNRITFEYVQELTSDYYSFPQGYTRGDVLMEICLSKKLQMHNKVLER